MKTVPVTAKEVAKWMLVELKRAESLYQEQAVYDIGEKFGKRFTYENQNGNLAISKEVLAEFRKLTEDKVVWVRGDRMWRFRESYDSKGRGQE